MTLIIKEIKGENKRFKVKFIQDNRYCYAEIPFKTMTNCLKDTKMHAQDAVERLITFHREEITIISLN